MKMLGNGSLTEAQQEFEKKFKDKSGLKWADRGEEPKAGKYAYVERSYNPDSDDVGDDDDAVVGAVADDTTKDGTTHAASTLSPPVQDLMKLIFNQVRPDLPWHQDFPQANI
jgi:poly [ADP-ribose] polymerase